MNLLERNTSSYVQDVIENIILTSHSDRSYLVVPKLKCICRKHSNSVVRQAGTAIKSTILVARHNFHVKSVQQLDTAKDLFSVRLPVKYCDMLQHFLLQIVWYILKQLSHEYLCSIIF